MAMSFMVERVAELDRAEIRRSVMERFSVERMADAYEEVYREMLEGGPGRKDVPRAADASAEEAAGVIPAERLTTRRADRAVSAG